MNRYQIGLLTMLLLLFVGCDSGRVYESDYDFEDQSWHMDTIPSFEFQIEDVRPKEIILKMRNSLDFPFRNCYLTYFLEDSTGNVLKTDLVNIELFDEKTGKPFGKGNSVFQHAEPILKSYDFPQAGNYKVRLVQYMRKADLVGTYSVGVRIEESSNK